VYKDSKTIKREHEAWQSERVREATDRMIRARVEALKTMEARRRFHNEEAQATDADMAAYYLATPTARRS
jgi:hypothetical protein